MSLFMWLPLYIMWCHRNRMQFNIMGNLCFVCTIFRNNIGKYQHFLYDETKIDGKWHFTFAQKTYIKYFTFGKFFLLFSRSKSKFPLRKMPINSQYSLAHTHIIVLKYYIKFTLIDCVNKLWSLSVFESNKKKNQATDDEIEWRFQ